MNKFYLEQDSNAGNDIVSDLAFETCGKILITKDDKKKYEELIKVAPMLSDENLDSLKTYLMPVVNSFSEPNFLVASLVNKDVMSLFDKESIGMCFGKIDNIVNEKKLNNQCNYQSDLLIAKVIGSKAFLEQFDKKIVSENLETYLPDSKENSFYSDVKKDIITYKDYLTTPEAHISSRISNKISDESTKRLMIKA